MNEVSNALNLPSNCILVGEPICYLMTILWYNWGDGYSFCFAVRTSEYLKKKLCKVSSIINLVQSWNWNLILLPVPAFWLAAFVHLGELFACERLSQENIHPGFVSWRDSLSSHWADPLKGNVFKCLVITRDSWPPRKGCVANWNRSYGTILAVHLDLPLRAAFSSPRVAVVQGEAEHQVRRLPLWYPGHFSESSAQRSTCQARPNFRCCRCDWLMRFWCLRHVVVLRARWNPKASHDPKHVSCSCSEITLFTHPLWSSLVVFHSRHT